MQQQHKLTFMAMLTIHQNTKPNVEKEMKKMEKEKNEED
jgi:hypothetical protein